MTLFSTTPPFPPKMPWKNLQLLRSGRVRISCQLGLPRFGGQEGADVVVESVEAVGNGVEAPFSTTPQAGGQSLKGEHHAPDTSTISGRIQESDC
jgi:hypothetical protein